MISSLPFFPAWIVKEVNETRKKVQEQSLEKSEIWNNLAIEERLGRYNSHLDGEGKKEDRSEKKYSVFKRHREQKPWNG